MAGLATWPHTCTTLMYDSAWGVVEAWDSQLLPHWLVKSACEGVGEPSSVLNPYDHLLAVCAHTTALLAAMYVVMSVMVAWLLNWPNQATVPFLSRAAAAQSRRYLYHPDTIKRHTRPHTHTIQLKFDHGMGARHSMIMNPHTCCLRYCDIPTSS